MLNKPSVDHFVLLDDMESESALLLSDFATHCSFDAAQLAAVDQRLQVLWDQGLYTFFYIPYEFGVALLNQASAPASAQQLHIFCFRKKEQLSRSARQQLLAQYADTPAGIAEPRLAIDAETFAQKIAAIHASIERGEAYQINFTSRLDFKSYGHPITLYRRLCEQQRVPYGALAHLPLAEQPWLLCFSPELFLDIQASGVVRAKPMKGTAPILNDAHDEARALALKNDLKNRAENLMIVDLLRNDLGRIAKLGSVKVPALFEVDRFGAVWQMTSTVEAQMPADISFSHLLKAAFPCGSITGAPKHMSMQLIEALEQRPRGIYTGSIGLLEANPEASKAAGELSFYGQLNVMIRSFHLQEADGYYQGAMGVGSGIVIDSQAATEYDELYWKMRFLLGLRPEFSIFETMRWEAGACQLLARHKKRLLSSAKALNYPLDAQSLEQALSYFYKQLPKQGSYRLKLRLCPVQQRAVKQQNTWIYALDSDFYLEANLFSLEALESQQCVLVTKQSIVSGNYLSRHKSDQRSVYDAVLKQALAHQAFDALMFDKQLNLLEGARCNVFLKIDGQWYTPTAELPILNGVMRQEILAHPMHYLGVDHVVEGRLHYEEVMQADEIVLTNALRGVLPVNRLII